MSSSTSCCPICADDMSLCGGGNPRRRAIGRPCCGQMLCQSCMYRHIRSVFDEGATGGRQELKCPLGCGDEMADGDIRNCLARQHASSSLAALAWKLLGHIIITWLQCFKKRQDPFQSSVFYQAWLYWGHTAEERRDLQRYEQWSLALGLRSMSKTTPTTTSMLTVMRCPAPDCDYAWLANTTFRREKFAHEERRYVLWYSPPKPESDNNMWVQPEYLLLGNKDGKLPEDLDDDRDDGRRVICAKCHSIFCGLCRRPWKYNQRRAHSRLSCQAYRRQLPHRDDDDHAFVAQLFSTKSCPGCSLLTSRIDGCNHMTCPCGKEWCYVCEKSWNVWHYSCVERQPRRVGENQGGGACVIS